MDQCHRLLRAIMNREVRPGVGPCPCAVTEYVVGQEEPTCHGAVLQVRLDMRGIVPACGQAPSRAQSSKAPSFRGLLTTIYACGKYPDHECRTILLLGFGLSRLENHRNILHNLRHRLNFPVATRRDSGNNYRYQQQQYFTVVGDRR